MYPEGNQSNNNQFFAAATGTVTAIDGLKASLALGTGLSYTYGRSVRAAHFQSAWPPACCLGQAQLGRVEEGSSGSVEPMARSVRGVHHDPLRRSEDSGVSDGCRHCGAGEPGGLYTGSVLFADVRMDLHAKASTVHKGPKPVFLLPL